MSHHVLRYEFAGLYDRSLRFLLLLVNGAITALPDGHEDVEEGA